MNPLAFDNFLCRGDGARMPGFRFPYNGSSICAKKDILTSTTQARGTWRLPRIRCAVPALPASRNWLALPFCCSAMVQPQGSAWKEQQSFSFLPSEEIVIASSVVRSADAERCTATPGPGRVHGYNKLQQLRQPTTPTTPTTPTFVAKFTIAHIMFPALSCTR